MIAVGTFVAFESPLSGVTYKGRVRERSEIGGTTFLLIKVAGKGETADDPLVLESACRVLTKKPNPQE